MKLVISSSHALPTREEVLSVLPELLAASGELERTTKKGTFAVLASLSPAWSNLDFEPDFAAMGWLDRAFLERQVERTHRDDQLAPQRAWPWVLAELTIAPLTDGSILDRPGPFELLLLEVPVLTLDRRRAVLRGQRQTPRLAEDFEHWFRKEGERWIATR